MTKTEIMTCHAKNSSYILFRSGYIDVGKRTDMPTVATDPQIQ
jgi:hypothetical protein